MRHLLIKHVENKRCSNYKSRVKQILTHVQGMLDMIQTSVKHEVVVVIGMEFDIKITRQKYRVYALSSRRNLSLLSI